MKKLILVFVAVIASLSISVAQKKQGKGDGDKRGHGHANGQNGMKRDSVWKNKTPEQRATRQSEMFAQKLSLSADQKQSVYKLILDRTQKAEAVRAKYVGGDRKAMHKEMKPIMQDFKTKFTAILTPDQVTKLEQLKAERKQKNQNKKGKMKTPEDDEHEDSSLEDLGGDK